MNTRVKNEQIQIEAEQRVVDQHNKARANHLYNSLMDYLRKQGFDVDATKKEVDFSTKKDLEQQQKQHMQAGAGVAYGMGGGQGGIEHPLMKDAAEFAGIERTKESPIAATNGDPQIIADWVNQVVDQLDANQVQQLANQLQHTLQYNPQLAMKIQQQLQQQLALKQRHEFNPSLTR